MSADLRRLIPASAWGFSYDAWEAGHARLSCAIEPRHLNAFGFAHGGLLSAILDEAGALAGTYAPDPAELRMSVTVDLAAHFVRTARGGVLTAVGDVVRAGRRLYFSRMEVTDAERNVIAFGSGTFRYM